ncbi:GHKL domain-containing protein [Clostridium estertheticum]|uniref:sensor histidine kinase n=1 Tax=Clostridium estertheticum TaxID=238834 RepID=UPI001C7D44B6|nr:ATP-binding protein [Clostridium estertheticum]MBX4260195.1 GHKL domain-containing protein [Clostridium estertheticum]WLC71098.1 GHKL domain-containing protein [Clostridium estertheticum]
MTREIILDIVEALLLLGVFSSLTNQKNYIVTNKLKSGLFCILYVCATSLSTFYVNNLYHTLTNIVVSILLLKLIIKISLYLSTIIFSLFFTIIFTSEIFVQFIGIFLLKVNLNEILSLNKYLFIFIILSKFLQIVIVILLLKFDVYFKNILLNEEKFLFSEFLIQIGIFNLFIYILIFSVLDIKSNQTYNMLIYSIYFVFSIIAVLYLKEREKMININSKYKIQNHQISNMEEIMSIIRQEKHDYANHINVIQALCCLNKPNAVEKIKEYVSKISDTIHTSFTYLNTGNDYIDGLLSIKNNYAMKNKINFNVIIDESFNFLKIREDELISIISNIIDNAFEVLKLKSYTENKEISITTYLENTTFCIEIANNGEGIPEEIKNKIFEKGFSTKTKQEGDNGFGLYITKQLVEHNNGNISVERVSGKTKFLVEFKM